jgi:uncharacterized protein involved in outer membrane biogenesis
MNNTSAFKSKPKLQLTLPNPKLLLRVGIGLAIVLGSWYALMFFMFKPETLKQDVITAMQHYSHLKVVHQGDERISYFPLPSITLTEVSIANDKSANDAKLVHIPRLDVRVNPITLFTGKMAARLTAISPEIYIHTLDDETQSWEVSLLENPPAMGEVLISGLDVQNGKLTYVYPVMNRKIEVLNLNGAIQPAEGAISSTFNFTVHNEPYKIALLSSHKAADNLYNVDLTFSDAATALNFKGEYDLAGYLFNGKQSLETKDLGYFLENILGNKHTPVTDETLKYPVSIQSTVKMDGYALHLTDMVINGAYAKGKGHLIAQMGAQPDIRAQMEMDTISLTPLNQRGVFDEFIAKPTPPADKFAIEVPEGKQSLLPKGVSMLLSLSAKESSAYGMPMKNLGIFAQLKDASIELKQFSAILPGETQTLIKGEIEGGFDGLGLRGSIDFYGQKLSLLLSHTRFKKLVVPPKAELFRARGNVYLTPKTTRVSEGILQTESIQLLGTLLREQKGESEFTTETSLRVANFNMDEFLQLQTDTSDNTLPSYAKSESWLRSFLGGLGKEAYLINLAMTDVVFRGEVLKAFNTKFALSENSLRAEDIVTRFKGVDMIGKASIAYAAGQPDRKPTVDIDLKLTTLDTSNFIEVGSQEDQVAFFRTKNKAGEEEWSRKEFELDWLKLFNGNLSLKIDDLVHGIYKMNNVDIAMNIDESTTTFETFDADIWGGKLASNFTLQTGRLPSISGKYAFEAIDFKHIHDFTDVYDNIEGAISIGGEISSSGFNIYTMMKNAQGTFAVAARDLTIKGFDVEKLVRAANAVRVSSDIDKIVAFAREGGETVVRTLTGNMNLNGGMLLTPGIAIQTDNAQGNIKGKIDTMAWTLNTAITLFLPTLQKEDPPSIRLVYEGSLKDPEQTLDTQSLESYVTKAAARRVLTE